MADPRLTPQTVTTDDTPISCTSYLAVEWLFLILLYPPIISRVHSYFRLRRLLANCKRTPSTSVTYSTYLYFLSFLTSHILCIATTCLLFASAKSPLTTGTLQQSRISDFTTFQLLFLEKLLYSLTLWLCKAVFLLTYLEQISKVLATKRIEKWRMVRLVQWGVCVLILTGAVHTVLTLLWCGDVKTYWIPMGETGGVCAPWTSPVYVGIWSAQNVGTDLMVLGVGVWVIGVVDEVRGKKGEGQDRWRIRMPVLMASVSIGLAFGRSAVMLYTDAGARGEWGDYKAPRDYVTLVSHLEAYVAVMACGVASVQASWREMKGTMWFLKSKGWVNRKMREWGLVR